MFVQLKDKGFLFSGLKEECKGLIGIERSMGKVPRGSQEEGPSPPQAIAQEPQICL